MLENKVDYWLNLADYDLSASKAMLNSKHYLYVGFMCHQTIEKALKAVFTKVTNETPPKIHNLSVLADKAQVYAKMSEEQKTFISEINPLNIEARYSEYKEEMAQTLSEEKCEQLIQETEYILCWIKRQL